MFCTRRREWLRDLVGPGKDQPGGAGRGPLAFPLWPSYTWGVMAVGFALRVPTEEQRERQAIDTQREFSERYCACIN